MTTATLTDTQVFTAPEDFILPELHYIEASKVGEFFSELPAAWYVRRGTNTIDRDRLDEKKQDLIYQSEGAIPVVRVNEPFLAFYADDPETGERKCFLLNGNTRRKNLIEMQNTSQYQGMVYASVPYRMLAIENPPKTLITRLQIDSNDTTDEHSTPQLAEFANQYYEEAFAELAQTRSDLSEAKRKTEARRVVCEILNITNQRLSQLLNFSNFEQWFTLLIGKNNLIPNYDLAGQIYAFSKDKNIPLTLIVQQLRDATTVQKPSITKKIWENFKAQSANALKPESEGSAVQSEGSTESTETGSTDDSSTAKSDKLLNREVAISNISKSLASLYVYEPETVSDDVDQELAEGEELSPEQKNAELISATVSNAIKLASTVIQKQAFPKSKAADVYRITTEFVQSFYDQILTDEVLKSLDDDILATLDRVAVGVSKPMALLTASDEPETDTVEDDEDSDYTATVEGESAE